MTLCQSIWVLCNFAINRDRETGVVIKIKASKWWEMLLNICPKNYSKLLLSYLGCPIEPIQGSSQLVREVLNWSKESFVIAKRGNVLPCVRALSLPLNLTLNLPASYPGNWLLLLHSLIPPHTHRLSQFLFTFASILRITVIMPV